MNRALNNGNFCVTKAGLAAGTTTTITIANNTSFAIGGKAYTKNAASNAATPTTDAVTGLAFNPILKATSLDAYGCVFVVALDSSGNIKVAQGEIVKAWPGRTGATSEFLETPEFPTLPDSLTAIGYIPLIIGNDLVAASWTFGSSNLATLTGCNRSFVDVLVLPDRPKTS